VIRIRVVCRSDTGCILVAVIVGDYTDVRRSSVTIHVRRDVGVRLYDTVSGSVAVIGVGVGRITIVGGRTISTAGRAKGHECQQAQRS
jgi:hypothetical protein